MRKKSARVARPAAPMLTPDQHGRLILMPRAHLDLLLSGMFDPQYAVSVAGVFNIAGAAAGLHQRNDIVSRIDAAQHIVERLLNERCPPAEEERQILMDAFNTADRYIGIQNQLTLAKAVRYVNARIASGDARRINGCAP